MSKLKAEWRNGKIDLVREDHKMSDGLLTINQHRKKMEKEHDDHLPEIKDPFNKNIHRTSASIILDEIETMVVIKWTYNPFELPAIVSVLDGPVDVSPRLDEKARKVVQDAVNRAAFDLPIEVHIRKYREKFAIVHNKEA